MSKNRVARRMRLLGLRSIVRRRFKVTTNSRHRFAVAPNRWQRDFTAQRPNQVWVSDLTYLRVDRGWLYLGGLHRPVFATRGWLGVELGAGSQRGADRSEAGRHSTATAEGTDHPLRSRRAICRTGFTEWVTQHGFVHSMSRKGDCWDNAVAESFFHLLKTRVDPITSAGSTTGPHSAAFSNTSKSSTTEKGLIQPWTT